MDQIKRGMAMWRCGLGLGPSCCSYLVCNENGFACGKSDQSIKVQIDQRRAAKSMHAMGDRCSGPPDYKEVGDVVGRS